METLMAGQLKTVSPDQTLLCFKKNVFYVALRDPDAETGLGKIINVDGRKTYSPNTRTAALLLYLLARDDDDPILYSDFLSLAMQYFSGATVENVTSFLEKLITQYKILKVTSGAVGTDDPDPLDVFVAESRVAWGEPEPDLIVGGAPICKSKTYFTSNYIKIVQPK